MPISTFFWGTGLRKAITSTAGAIAAVAGAIVAVPPAWSALGLPEVAFKTYVDSTVAPIKTAQAKTEKTLRDIQLDIATGKLDDTEDKIANWQLQLDRAVKAGDEEQQKLIGGQIRKLEDTRDQLNDQIKTLRSLEE